MKPNVKKYRDFIVNDVTTKIEFNDPIFFHMVEYNDNILNSCNLFGGNWWTILRDRYGIETQDFFYIMGAVGDYLDKEYPNRCDD